MALGFGRPTLPPVHIWKKWRPYQSRQRSLYLRFFVISGITKDSSGSPLPSCLVKLYSQATDVVVTSTVSDSSTGAYSFAVPDQANYYAVAYKAGSPDVAGTTVNTLVGT